MQKRKCKNPDCQKEFVAVNGTQNYCNAKCYGGMKKQRQKLLDDLIKDFRKGINRNYKLFRKLLPQSGGFEIELEQAYIKGFDEYAYYGISKDEVGAKWQHVGIFCFNIGHLAGIPKLNIYKK